MCIIANLVKRWRIWSVQEILLSVGSKIITNCDHPFSLDINYFIHIGFNSRILNVMTLLTLQNWSIINWLLEYWNVMTLLTQTGYIINWLPIYFWWRWFKSEMWGCSLSFLRSGLREEKRCLPAKRRYYTEFSPNTDVQAILSKYNRDVL